MGAVAALLVSLSFFSATLKLPVFRAFEVTTFLLILFAAGLAGRGVHEFAQAGWLPKLSHVTMPLIPPKNHLAGDLIKAMFGWSQSMDGIQLVVYATYIGFMRWYLFGRKVLHKALVVPDDL
jgi:high-affinity Fe2+/Pb2+ permease